MSPTISRRTFLVAAGGSALTATGWQMPAAAAFASAVAPAPSMTTTSGAPRVLAAHCGVLGQPSASPALRPESMQVSVVVTEPAAAKVRAWPIGRTDSVVESHWTPTRTGGDASNPVNVAKFWMPAGTGAPPTAWNWQTFVALPGTPPTAGVGAAYGTDGVIRLIPPRPAAGAAADLTFAAGSCTQIARPGEPTRPIRSAVGMANAPLAFVVHMGDTSYVDTWKTISEDTTAHRYTKFAAGLRGHFTQPDLVRLYNNTTVRMVLDDHDAGPDNCYAANVYPQARQVLTDISAGTSFDNAGYDLTNPTAPTYDTWASGAAQFWLLDNRLWRDTPGTTPQTYRGHPYTSQLGATQRNWLLSGLAASSAPVKVVFSPRTFKSFYATDEQQEILDWITGFQSGSARVSGKVIFLTGDMHAGAVWRLSGTRPVYEMLCAPIYNTEYHTPTELKSWQTIWGYQTRFLNTIDGRPGTPAVSSAWGKVTIHADTSVTLNLMKDDGTLLYQQQIPAT
jgi:hypothetical protein